MVGWYVTAYGTDHPEIIKRLTELANSSQYTNAWFSYVPIKGVYLNSGESATAVSDKTIAYDRTYTVGGSNTLWMNYGLYLGWVETTTSAPPNLSFSWTQINANSFTSKSALDYFLPTFAIDLEINGFFSRHAVAISLSRNLVSSSYDASYNHIIGVIITESVAITGTTVTGIKPSFYTAKTIEDAFENPTNMRQTLYKGNNCVMYGYTVNVNGTTIYGVTHQSGKAYILKLATSTDTVPSAFWTDVRNPAKTYTELWTSYPTVMPQTISEVYTLRELPSLNTALTALTTPLNAIKTSIDTEHTSALQTTIATIKTGIDAMTAVHTTGNTYANTLNTAMTTANTSRDTGNTRLVELKTSLEGKLDALNTSVVAGNTLDSARNTTLTATNTAVGSLQTAINTQLGNLKTAADASTTQLTSLNSSVLAVSTAMEGVETAVDIVGGHLSLGHADLLAVKTALDSGNTATGLQTSAIQAMAIGLGNAFDDVFGAGGSLISVMQSSGPNQANIVGIMTMVGQGATASAIRAAYPYESLVYAKEIDVMQTLSSDRLTLATSALIGAMQATGSAGNLIPIITEYPELLLHAGDIITMDRWMKTGISP